MGEYLLKIVGVHYGANGDSVAGQKDTEEMHVRTREMLSWIDWERPIVVLSADPTNHIHKDAIMARAQGRRIGRVAYEDVDRAWDLLRQSGRPMLVAKVQEVVVREHGYVVVTVSGDVKFDRLVRLCEKYFGTYENHPSAVDRSLRPQFQVFDRYVNRHTHQAHLLLGCEAPDVYHGDKTAFTLLNNILGGPAMNSRLNVAVRERYGFCYSIESQYVPFSDTGLFYIYAGVDLDAQERARRLIADELMRMAEQPLTAAQLRSAQRQMVGQMAINDDFGMNEMQSIGKAYLCYDHVNTLEEMEADLMAVTAADLQRVARERFAPERFSTLVYGN